MTVLTVAGLSKTYGGVHALSDVSLQVQPGKVHALLGENGAGKSTLIKILAGAVTPDMGEIALDGRPVAFSSPRDSASHGLAFVHQDPSLVPTMSVAENMFLGTEHHSRHGFTTARSMRKRYATVASRVGLSVDPNLPASRVSIADQTLVALGRALVQESTIIVLDEPTATFSDSEAESLFRIIGDLTARGVAIIYVSHRLDEVIRLADAVTVLKNGQLVASMDASEVRGKEHLIEMIVAGPLDVRDRATGSRVRAVDAGPPVLEAISVTDGARVVDASVEVRAGEIVGLTGLVGSGRTEFAKLLFGASRLRGGQIRVSGVPVSLASPHAAVAHGIGLVPEDRRHEGVIMDSSIRENVTLPIVSRFRIASWLPVVKVAVERVFVRDALGSLRVRLSSIEQNILELSGGNQQKVVIAKWAATSPKILIVDEPTQGVDVGAKAEIYAILRDIASQGAGVLLISSEVDEAIAQSDRVVVFREGRTVADLRDATEQQVLAYCYGSGQLAPRSNRETPTPSGAQKAEGVKVNADL